jgi:hypothetical protein
MKDEFAKMIFGMSVSEAHEKKICIACKQPITFPTELDHREYLISGLCSECFEQI